MPVKSKKQEKFMQAVAHNPKFAKKVGVKQSIGREFTKEKDMKKVKKMQMGGMTDREGRAMATGRYANDPRLMADARGRAMMKKGGKVKKMRDGGNTSRTNELEELGRVDAEKGYSTKGKRNLRDEKARVVREIKGKKAGGMVDKEGRALAKNKKGMTASQMKDARGRAMKKGGKVKKGRSTDKSTVLFNKVKNEVKKSTGPEKNISAMTSKRIGAKNKMEKDFISGYGRVYDMEEKRKNEYKTGSKNVKPKAMKKGGMVKSSASKRADGIAQQGHTKGRIV